MPPPIDRSDEERLLRLISRMLDERLKPVDSRPGKSLGAVREEVSPAVARKIAESQLNIEGRSEGFERIVLDAITSLREEAHEAKAIALRTEAALQPRTTVSFTDGSGRTSIQPASLVAAASSVRTEVTANQTLGQTKALQVDVESADKNALAAKKAAQRTMISTIVGGVLLGIYYAWQAIHSMGP